LDEVFDDGGMSSSKQQIGVNAGELLNGYFTMYYERYMSRHIGLGVQLGYLVNDGVVTHDYFIGYTDFTSGLMFKFYYKKYYKFDYRGLFFEWNYQYRYRSQEKYKNAFQGLGFMYGYRLFYHRIGLSAYGGGMYGNENREEQVLINGVEEVNKSNDWGLRLQIGLNVSFNF